MYFIELILKKISDFRKKNIEYSTNQVEILEAERNFVQGLDDFQNCVHVFMPLDSSGESLACTNCGFVIKKEDLNKYKNNPFS